MKYFFIDYENAKSAGLLGADRLTKNDKVILFYTIQTNNVPVEFYVSYPWYYSYSRFTILTANIY